MAENFATVDSESDNLREKRDAFDRLAALVERIVNPPSDNVVTMSPQATAA